MCNTYLNILFFGFIQSAIITVLSGHQRTIGKQKNILHLRIFAVILNLILDTLVVNLGFGISGVAWVTVFINSILAIYLFIISKSTVIYQLNKKYCHEIMQLFKWNFLERIATRLDNFIFNILVSRMGSNEYEKNDKLDVDHNGEITRGEALQAVLDRRKDYEW